MAGAAARVPRFALMTEWRAIPGYEGRYEISDDGRVRSLARRCLTGRGDRAVPAREPRLKGVGAYLGVMLSASGAKATRLVHDLVLSAFVGPRPDAEQARHLNGNARDNRLSNLSWGTAAENANDRIVHGTQPRGEDHARAILTEVQVREIRAAQRGIRRMGAAYGVSRSTIEAIRARRIWRHVV